MRGPIYFLFYVQEMAAEIDKTKDRHIEDYVLWASDHKVQCFVRLAHQFPSRDFCCDSSASLLIFLPSYVNIVKITTVDISRSCLKSLDSPVQLFSLLMLLLLVSFKVKVLFSSRGNIRGVSGVR